MIRHMLIIGMLSLLAGKAVAQNDGCCDCPDCGHKVCYGKTVTKKVKKTLYRVEKKDICIPKFRFPWQIKKSKACGSQCDASCDSGNCGDGNCGCAAPLCGRVRTVKVLKKRSIECEKCGYEWEITTVESAPCCNSGSLRRRACDTSCDSSLNYLKK